MADKALLPLLKQVEQLSRDVASWMLESRVRPDQIEFKGVRDLVSYVDKQAEQRFVEGLAKLLPEAGFIAEEGTGEARDGLNWIIDPLDGTTNFLHRLPAWCTSVALADGEDLLLGVVMNPVLDECFTALQGAGSLCNGAAIAVSEAATLDQSLVATGFPYDRVTYRDPILQAGTFLFDHTRGMRRMGSAAIDLCYVACGRFDAYFEHGLKPWDLSAGALIAREAGARVTQFEGGNEVIFRPDLLAANPVVHAQLLQHIAPLFWMETQG